MIIPGLVALLHRVQFDVSRWAEYFQQVPAMLREHSGHARAGCGHLRAAFTQRSGFRAWRCPTFAFSYLQPGFGDGRRRFV